MVHRFIFPFLIFTLIRIALLAQPTACQKAEKLVFTLNLHHIQPLSLDDSWSQRVFENFFVTLDPLKIYFTKEDIQKLNEYSLTLDDLIKNQKSCAFVDVVAQVFKEKVQRYDSWLAINLAASFNYSELESFDALRFHNHSFSLSDPDLEIRWKHYLKYQILVRMNQEKIADSTSHSNSLVAYEKIAREKIKNIEQQKNKAILQKKEGYENPISHSFLQAIASAYDPHTAYYSYEEKEDFEAAISPSELSFGFALEESQLGTIRLISIVPGSPAWNSNDMHEGDFLISIETPDKQLKNVMDLSIDELEDWLDSHAVQQATFTIKKTDGTIKQVTLTKEKIESIENTVSGVVLKGVKNIGYISLPSFYFDWSNDLTAGCANDVAKAIIKLNKEKIEGLIIDLRFNGGGSLQEAMGLAGIFLDYGPLGLYQEAGQPLVTLKDQHKGTIYNGPLLIMVNGFSGSASEFFAATLQDYNRALIVGSRTFGKATGQSIFPMTKSLDKELISKSDHAKITTLKIYRITGKTYQHKGVIPDITLPDLTDVFDLQESALPYALSSDSIAKKTYYTPFPNFPVPLLREKSNVRAMSSSFQAIESYRKALSVSVPVDLKGFSEYILQVEEPSFNTNSIFTAHNTNFDNPLLAVDSFRKSLNDTFLSEIEESVYLQEAYTILLDYIAIQKK